MLCQILCQFFKVFIVFIITSESISYFSSIRVNIFYRIVQTICIRTGIVVLLRHGIDGGEASYIRTHVPGTVVVPVKAVRAVEFLAVEFEPLGAAACTFPKQAAKGIVMIYLFRCTSRTYDYAVAAKMILEVVVVIGRCTTEGDIATIN